MSGEIEFDDVVDFDSEEESESDKEEVDTNLVAKTKISLKNSQQNGDVLNDHKPQKESFEKESLKSTTNEYISKPDKSAKKERISEKFLDSENEKVKLNLSDSMTMLTDDEEITKILNTKYEGRFAGMNGNADKAEEIENEIDDIEAYIAKIKLEDKSESHVTEVPNGHSQGDDNLDMDFVESLSTHKERDQTDEFDFCLPFRETSKVKSSSPVDFEKKDSTAGRIELTRNYLKALTPDEGLKGSSEKEVHENKDSPKNAFFEIGKRNEDGFDVMEDSAKDEVSDGLLDKGDTMENVNEENSQLKRRQSMDDFIQKILAEAREDKDNGNEDDNPSIVPKKEENEEDVSIEQVRKNGKDIKSETDLLLENILSSSKIVATQNAKTDEKITENGFSGKYFNKSLEGSEEINIDTLQNDKENVAEISTKRNRNRMVVKKRDEAEDEIEKILSSKKYQPSSKPPKKPIKKVNGEEILDGLEEDSAHVNGDTNDDFRNFLSKFKKDRQKLFGQERNSSHDSYCSTETQEYVKDKTQNIRAVLTQQSNISENVKSVSKQLDELDKELREVRQTTLERKSRLEALENAVNAEKKQYEIEHNSAIERNRNKKPLEKYSQEVKNQITASILSKKPQRYSKFSEDQDDITALLSSSKRRVGSVCSVASLMEENDSFLSSNSFFPSNDRHKYRSISKDRDLLGARSFDRKEGSLSREGNIRSSFAERNTFEDFLSGGSEKLTQSRPRSRASIATMDLSHSTADDFLNKIRSKYTFLSSKDTPDTGIENNRGGVLERMSYSGIKHMNNQTPQYHTSLTNGSKIGSESLQKSYGGDQTRRSNSVSDGRSSIHFDKSIGGYTAFPSRTHLPAVNDYTSRPAASSHTSVRGSSARGGDSKFNSSNGEFKSRFLNKVRERKACAVDHTPGTSQLADRVRAKLSSQKESSSPLKTDKDTAILNGD